MGGKIYLDHLLVSSYKTKCEVLMNKPICRLNELPAYLVGLTVMAVTISLPILAIGSFYLSLQFDRSIAPTEQLTPPLGTSGGKVAL
jgi:hypothetical protein